jgi:hypothetical protein
MAVPPLEPVVIDAWRDELDTVLRSQPFLRAPTLAALLSYLCNKRFSGQAAQIKEYCIGSEVLNRGDSFDPETDSIVRVEVNRLRKRLAAYYAAEGASHSLRIVIPVGQYVPAFEPAPAPADAAPVLAGPDPASPKPSASPSRKILHRALPIALAAIVVLLAAALVLRWPRPRPSPAPQPAPQPIASGPLFGPPPGDEVRILAGSTRGYVDHADKLWSADRWFTGGTAVPNDIRHFAYTSNPSFYLASRQGQFRYDIPLPPGIYELHLYFAETVFGPDNSGVGGEGSRLFTVTANGRVLLAHFDILADAGGGRIADDRVFIDQSPAKDGFLHLRFAGENGSAALLSAIQIVPGIRGKMLPVRILARQTPYYSNDSQWWAPDDDYEGGQLATYADPVKGTDDPELYESERWGNFSYAIPAPPGRYTVVLRFVARHRAAGQLPLLAGPPAYLERVFNVFCNGQAILENFNLAQEASQQSASQGHPDDVVIRRFPGLQPNAQGKLILSFVPVRGYASVTGIEVLPE